MASRGSQQNSQDHLILGPGIRGIRVKRLIANGGYGEVYELEYDDSRKVSNRFADLLKNEAKAARKLCSPGSNKNVVGVLRLGWLTEDRYFIDMEYCMMNLAEKIECVETPFNYLTGFTSNLPRLEMKEIMDILLDICAGLVYIHQHGHVHRDLKPKNVLYSDEDRCWKIADFGISREGTSKGLHATLDARGSPSYRAPELLEEAALYNNKADIWALGCMLYELCSGVKLFSTDYHTFEYKRTGLLDLPVPWPEIDSQLAVKEMTLPLAKALWLLNQQFKAMLSLDQGDRQSANALQTSWKEIRRELILSMSAGNSRDPKAIDNRLPPAQELPFSVDADSDSGARRHRKLVNDCWTLADVLIKSQSPTVQGMRSIIQTLSPCTPYVMELLKFQFFETTGQWLYAAIERYVAQAAIETRIVLTGLSLGPVAFDAYLLSGFGMFVEILVGIHPGNLDCLRDTFLSLYGLDLGYAILEGPLSQANSSSIYRETPLRFAIRSALSIRRPPPETPVDHGKVRADVNVLRTALGRASSRYEEILTIFLSSSDSHIAQMASHFQLTEHMRLDLAIESSNLKDVAKAVAIQAIRSATDIVYRDVMLLKDACNRPQNDKVTLGIRVNRMHWFPHWGAIQTEFRKVTGRRLGDIRAEDGLFGELIGAMAKDDAV